MTTALEEAAWVYGHIKQYSKQQRFDAAVSLSEWGIFSLRHVGLIVGLSHTTVRRIAKHKPDKTGGTFSPECLVPLLSIQKRHRRGEPIEAGEVRAALDAGTGTSAYFAAKLAGVKESWIRKNSKERSNDGKPSSEGAGS